MKKYKPVLKDYKKLFSDNYKEIADPNLTRKENIQRTINYIARIIDSAETTEDNYRVKGYASVAVKGLVDDFNNVLTHYFISDKSLVEFLKTTEIKDTSIVDEYLKENLKLVDEQHFDTKYLSLAVHTEEEGYFISYIGGEGRIIVVMVVAGRTISFDLSKYNKYNDPYCNLAINFIYYMKAFPEKIIDGVPQDMVKSDRKEKYNDTKNFTIGIAEQIVAKQEYVDGRLVSPHFRSGFFRHYVSDFYVNMKGKVVFIEATMVKGKAKTVIK